MSERELRELVDARQRDVRGVELRHHLEHAIEFAEHGRERVELLCVRKAARDRMQVLVHVHEAGREADGARRETLAQEILHHADLVGGRGALLRVGAHRPHPDHAVARERRDVERDAPAQCGDVVGEALPRPLEGAAEGGVGHLLDLLEHADQLGAVLGLERRQRERAVAVHHGGDAVLERRPRLSVPEQLRVEMRVRVDEAGCDDEAVGVDRASCGRAPQVADRFDDAASDAEVSAALGRARSIDDAAIANQDVEHGDSSWGSTSSSRCHGCPRRSAALCAAQSSISLRAHAASSVTEPRAPFA